VPEIITAAQLRTVLGVSTGLYSDTQLDQIIDTAEGVISALVIPQEDGLSFYADVPEIQSAVIELSVEILNSRVAPGGAQQGLDFTPSPYRMGQSLARRISGLLSNYRDTGGMVG
jgi:hypothetical protein